jgi:hypothetical protein
LFGKHMSCIVAGLFEQGLPLLTLAGGGATPVVDNLP